MFTRFNPRTCLLCYLPPTMLAALTPANNLYPSQSLLQRLTIGSGAVQRGKYGVLEVSTTTTTLMGEGVNQAHWPSAAWPPKQLKGWSFAYDMNIHMICMYHMILHMMHIQCILYMKVQEIQFCFLSYTSIWKFKNRAADEGGWCNVFKDELH